MNRGINLINPDHLNHFANNVTAPLPSPWREIIAAKVIKAAQSAAPEHRNLYGIMPYEVDDKPFYATGGNVYGSDVSEILTQKWARRALAERQTLYVFRPNLVEVISLIHHVCDYVNSLLKQTDPLLQPLAEYRLRKLNRLRFGQISFQADEWFAKAQHIDESKEKDGIVPLLKLDDLTWVEIIDADCLDREGVLMQHCVGGGSYDCDLGKSRRILSLRDGNNQPHVTIEMHMLGEHFIINQMSGKQNRQPVVKYLPAIVDLLRYLPIRLPLRYRDFFEHIGIFCQPDTGDFLGELASITEIGTHLAHVGGVDCYKVEHGDTTICVAMSGRFARYIFREVKGRIQPSEIQPPDPALEVQVLNVFRECFEKHVLLEYLRGRLKYGIVYDKASDEITTVNKLAEAGALMHGEYRHYERRWFDHIFDLHHVNHYVYDGDTLICGLRMSGNPPCLSDFYSIPNEIGKAAAKWLLLSHLAGRAESLSAFLEASSGKSSSV